MYEHSNLQFYGMSDCVNSNVYHQLRTFMMSPTMLLTDDVTKQIQMLLSGDVTKQIYSTQSHFELTMIRYVGIFG